MARPDGERFPGVLRGIRALASRGLRRRLAIRMLVGRLPAFVAHYPDGRCFAVERGDVHYGPVFFGKEYEPAESTLVRGILEPGDFAVDVGAHMGWYTLLMATSVGPSGRVWAVEPTPATRSRLVATLDRNDLPAVEVLPLALADYNGTGAVHLFSGLPHGHASMSTLGRGDYTAYPTEVRRLDSLVEERGVPVPTLIKVDAEGGELAVLEGATGLLSSDRPPLWLVEVNREAASAHGYAPPAMLDAVRRHSDYEAYRVTRNGLVLEDAAAESDGVSWLLAPSTHSARLAGLFR